MRSANKFRKRLWQQNPHCENCGIITILPEDVPGNIIKNGLNKLKHTPENMATIQHTRSRLNPERGKRTGGKRVNELWCFKCNMEDSKQEQKLKPEIIKIKMEEGKKKYKKYKP